jgi:hypothetical protein
MSEGPHRSPSGTLRAAGGPVDALDKAQAEIAREWGDLFYSLLAYVRERHAAGFFDIAPSELEMLAHEIEKRVTQGRIHSRKLIATAMFEALQQGVNQGKTWDDSHRQTREDPNQPGRRATLK